MIYLIFHCNVNQPSAKTCFNKSFFELGESVRTMGDYFPLPKPYAALQYADTKAMCIIGFNITMCRASTHSEHGEIGTTASMLWHDFPLPINYDMD